MTDKQLTEKQYMSKAGSDCRGIEYELIKIKWQHKLNKFWNREANKFKRSSYRKQTLRLHHSKQVGDTFIPLYDSKNRWV